MATKSQKHRNERTLKILLIALIALVVIAGAVTLIQNAGGKNGAEGKIKDAATLTGTHYVAIDVQDHGTITAELYADAAPITVENFMHLVDEKFYDGLTFHRIINGFMVQGGCPYGNGTGGAAQDIKGEFAANGVENPLKHVRGAISMARSNHPDSASSQFFIVHQDASHLDGSYAAFGKVLSGMEIVDALCTETPVQDGNGTVLKADQPVITSIRRIEKP